MIVNCLNGYGKPAVADDLAGEQALPRPESEGLRLRPRRSAAAADGRRLHRPRRRRRHRGRQRQPVSSCRSPPTPATKCARRLCSILKEDWDKLGIKVNYRPLDFQALVEKLYTDLRLGRDADGLHRRRRAEQRRQPAALERQPASLEPDSRSRRRRGRPRSTAARPGRARARHAEAPHATTGASRRSCTSSCR